MTPLRSALQEFDTANRADGLADKTLNWYRWLLDDSPHSLTKWLAQEVALETLSTSVLRQYIVWLRGRVHSVTGQPLANDTIHDYIRALHRLFAWSAAEYSLPNPMGRIAYPKSKANKPKAIDMADLRKMFAVCQDDVRGKRNRALMGFMIDTGVRAGEVCGLTVDQVELEQRKATVTGKGSRTRVVPFTGRTAGFLTDWRAVSPVHQTMFLNLQTVQPLTVSGLRHVLMRIAHRAGVTGRVNPHSFRHAFAREYIFAGGSLAMLAVILGHRSVTTTTGYYALFSEWEISQQHERFSPMNHLWKVGG